jgi:hypothetical protein
MQRVSDVGEFGLIERIARLAGTRFVLLWRKLRASPVGAPFIAAGPSDDRRCQQQGPKLGSLRGFVSLDMLPRGGERMQTPVTRA